MEIKTFRAATLQEALQQIRDSMGADACVLATRELRKSRLGLFASTIIEVEASCESPALGEIKPLHKNLTAAQSERHQPFINDVGVAARPREPLAGTTGRVATGLGTTLTPAMHQVLSSMLEARLEPRVAKALLTESCESLTDVQCHQTELIRSRMLATVSARLRTYVEPPIDPDAQRVIALVGSTGVGKTTTLAKLASNYQLQQACQVGLVTLDMFRFGAVDQLLQYAEEMSASLEVVSSPEQIAGALHRLRDSEVVLLDTAGRSPMDAQHVGLLAESLHAAKPDSVHLVVSATSSQDHLRSSLARFAELGPTSLIVTKLDEADSLGPSLEFLCDCGLPISHVTHGQRVPQDIASPTVKRLTEMLLGQATNVQVV